MTEPADQESREKFIHELDRNFSVIASAGSGKTLAITHRIVEIAKSPQARDWLPKLVVVTYTNRAADEMQQRSRTQILDSSLSLDVLAAFNRAFFGTIHSFCLKLLANYGHYIGLPSELETITDDKDLWNEFVQRQMTIGRSLSEENRASLLRHVQVRDLMELARSPEIDFAAGEAPKGACPDTDFSSVYAAVVRNSTTVPRLQKELKRWEQRWRETREFVSWPICTSLSKKYFIPLWREAFRPLREWVNACAVCVAAEVQSDYREFRLQRGALTYRDQVALALELMRRPEVARQIRQKTYRVILDEAQDTEPQQFSVLLEMARPLSAIGLWTGDDPPRAGHFCMVGDFQQSIYRDRAELDHYRRLHERLIETGAADALQFSVTFRLDRAQLDFVNQIFPEILNNACGQVDFVQLNPRVDILSGQVIRLDFAKDFDATFSDEQRAQIEARELAEWIRGNGLKKLRADSWQQVAILSPRKAWLRTIRDALSRVDLRAQIQSESDLRGESPAYAWLTALLKIMTDPNDSYEIVGVLREVFGISDDDLARFTQGKSGKLQIAERTGGRGAVSEALDLLAGLYQSVAVQPLFTTVREIIRATQLRERLLTLPQQDFPDLEAELDALLTSAAAAEATGTSMEDFAENLRADFDAIRDVRSSSHDAIQLITEHKAKGLEWQAVIVPFLSRWVRTISSRYPRVIKRVGKDVPQIAFDNIDISPELQMEVRDSDRQKMERLLYVALTRAKHSLVIAFDRQLFANARSEIQADSQIKWLRADPGETNRTSFEALPVEPKADRATSAQAEQMLTLEPEEGALPALEEDEIQTARENGSRFFHKMNPSALDAAQEISDSTGADKWKEAEPNSRPITPPNRAMQYGVWWHDFMQFVPWDGENSWEELFAARRADAPDATRFAREWKLLRDHLDGDESFRRHVDLGDLVAHTEMPFLWRADARSCLEGIVDLALLDRSARRWFIVDWKTNQIGRDRKDELKRQYRLQISAYWKALGAITKMPVEAALFSTSTGALLRYDEADLKDAWSELNQLSPRKQAQAIQLDLL